MFATAVINADIYPRLRASVTGKTIGGQLCQIFRQHISCRKAYLTKCCREALHPGGGRPNDDLVDVHPLGLFERKADRAGNRVGCQRLLAPLLQRDLHGLDRPEATAALLAAYFRRYGPASIADAAWWLGAGEARVRQFIADHARDLVEVTVEGVPAACYLFVEDRDALVDCRAEPHVEFLAYEDNLQKSYKESRARFVAAVDYAQGFNLIGEARATILVDGRIAGVWQFNKRTGRIDCILFDDLDKTTSALIDSRRRRLEELLTNGTFPPML